MQSDSSPIVILGNASQFKPIDLVILGNVSQFNPIGEVILGNASQFKPTHVVILSNASQFQPIRVVILGNVCQVKPVKFYDARKCKFTLCFNFRFQYVLSAPTSPATKMNEETLTYLNQGQAYDLKIKKIGNHNAQQGSKYYKV